MSKPFISVANAQRQYQVKRGLFGRGKTLHAVAGVSFDVPAGSTFGLVGESGSGKSTLARLVLAAEPVSGGSIRVGEHELAGLQGARRKAFHRTVQPVLQDPYSSLSPQMRIADIIGEPLRVHGLASRGEVLAKAEELLTLVGLAPEMARRHPHELSGGQRQRVAIARALGLQPQALVLDEPVSALDVSIQAQILNLLKDLQRARGLTYLLISHDLAVVAYMSDQVGVLYLGEFMELGTREDVVGRARHPYTRALIASSESRVEAAPTAVADIPSPIDLPGGCRFQSRCPHATARCAAERPVLRPVGAAHWIACHYDIGDTAGTAADAPAGLAQGRPGAAAPRQRAPATAEAALR
jgi:oligopeptide/dipeptide ABC transporter ATP-binding protein